MKLFTLKLPIKFNIDSYRFTFLQCKHGTFCYHIHPHSHGKNSYEINVILDGYGTLISSNKEYRIEPGVFFVHGPHIEHSIIPDEGTNISDCCISVLVEPIDSKSSTKPNIANLFYNTRFYYGKDSDNIIAPILQQIESENKTIKLGYSLLLEGLFKQFFVILLRYYCIDSRHTNDMLSMDLNEYRLTIIERSFIQDCVTITLEELSYRIRCSYRQTQRIIKEAYGKTFRELKAQYILEKAKYMLTTTNDSIEAIASKCGYDSTESFNKFFHKHYFMSPKQYRNNHK